MRFWIDLANSPHVLFFEPIIKKLKEDGHQVFVTAREFAQTVPLIKKKGIEAEIFGRHMGKSLLNKSIGLLKRSALLYLYGRRIKADVALSHNSNDLALAAYLLKVPHLVFVDYEYASFAHRFNLMFVQKILFPEPVDIKKLSQLYGHAEKFGNYPGLKEQVYIPFYEFTPVRDQLGVLEEEVLAVVRPPADFALYHRFENPLFEKCLDYLKNSPAKVVVVCRTKEQEEKLKNRFPQFIYPQEVLDGPSLIKDADLVLSAGGTMNREAAALNTPAYSVFAGKIGDVDKFLIEKGLLKKVSRPEDIEIKKKKERNQVLEPTLNKIIDIIYRFSEGRL